MNGVRIGIVASLLLCIWLAWPKGNGGTPPRPLMIKSALKDANEPIIVLGDDIVRQAALPRTLCKRPVINAGIDGTTASSALGEMLKKALGNKKAAMIVVSLGSNDADAKSDVTAYRQNYASLLATLKPMTERLAVIQIAGVEVDKPQGYRTPQIIDSYNAALPDIARNANASVIALPTMSAGFTNNGVALNDTGYLIWNRAISDNIEAALCPPS